MKNLHTRHAQLAVLAVYQVIVHNLLKLLIFKSRYSFSLKIKLSSGLHRNRIRERLQKFNIVT